MDTTRSLGELHVSLAGLGCNNFGRRIDAAQAAAVVNAACDVGVNFFDTADVYGDGASEEYLGKAIGTRRSDVLIATKFGATAPERTSGGDPSWVLEAADASLRRLGTDYIDLFWLHRPDESVAIGETLGALNSLIDAGKVREIACSNFSAGQLDEAAQAATERGIRPFAAVQNRYSLLSRQPESDVLPTCERLGITLVPYSPLESGFLTAKYRRDEEPQAGTRLAAAPAQMREQALSAARFDRLERLEAYAAAHDHTLHELALSWLASNPLLSSVIAGATTPEQVRVNTAAMTAWDVSDAERAEIDDLLEG
jgi:aryl-alcohol dehydrogenase-like predicted oxidoreductase